MHSGYVKLWRKMEKSAFFTSSEAVHIFVFLLMRATRVEREMYVGHQKIKLAPGQLVTGRKAISAATGINESKVYRVLKLLKSEQQIEQQMNSKFSIISICNWSQYQEDEQQIEQQVNIKRTASEHKQEVKALKKESITVDCHGIIDAFHKFCPSLPRVKELTLERRQAITKLWHKYEKHDGGALRFFDTLFKKAEASDWISGRNEKGWRGNIDFILREKCAVKIIEGGHDNTGNRQGLQRSHQPTAAEDEWARRMAEKTARETNRG